MNGWAMEARLYAENPATGFLPSTGRLEHLVLPDFVRVDTGVEEGAEVTGFYDPMIAKIIVHEKSRHDAVEELWEALTEIEVWPVRTNAGFLAKLCLDEQFRAGTADTGLILREGDALMPPALPSEDKLAEAADMFVGDQPLFGFRLNASAIDEMRALVDRQPTLLPRRRPGPSRGADRGTSLLPTTDRVAGPRPAPGRVLIAEAGQTWSIESFRAFGIAAGSAANGAILSPMPGRIIAVDVSVGDVVVTGQKLVTLEAMKMEHSLTAPFDGTVAELSAETGGQVSEGTLLVRVERDAA